MIADNLYPNGNIQKLLDSVEIPAFYKVRQSLPQTSMSEEEISYYMETQISPFVKKINKGEKIGITVGSRGIDHMVDILSALVKKIKEAGADPYIVPCMGSHGVNPEGRKNLLEGFGISEQSVGCKMANYDDLSFVGKTESGLDVYIDSFLYNCDKIIVINRVKPHTAFHGPVESGLQKMMAVGMGKQKGASICHLKGFYGMCDRIMAIADVIIKTGKIFMGIAIVENACGKLCEISAMYGCDIQKKEPVILEKARKQMPSLPFSYADVLIVDYLGKDISGSGMDTNIIGRYPLNDLKGTFSSDRLVTLSLTKAADGNAHGVGFADYIPVSLLRQIDFEHTYPNGITNKTPNPAKIPCVMPDGNYAVKAAIMTCPNADRENLKMVRVENTHNIDVFYATRSLIDTALRPLEILEGPSIIDFNI